MLIRDVDRDPTHQGNNGEYCEVRKDGVARPKGFQVLAKLLVVVEERDIGLRTVFQMDITIHDSARNWN